MWEEAHELILQQRSTIISSCTSDNLLVCGRADAIISVWDLYQLQEIKHIDGHKRSVLSVKLEYFPKLSGGEGEELFLFSSSSDNTIKVCD